MENNEVEGIKLLRDEPKNVSKLGIGLASGSSSISAFKAADASYREYLGICMDMDNLAVSYDSSKHGDRNEYISRKLTAFCKKTDPVSPVYLHLYQQ